MIRLLQTMLAVFVLLQIPLFPLLAAEDGVLSIDDVLKNVDPEKVTKAEVKEYYKEISGKKARGEGTVVHILPGTRDIRRIAVRTRGSDPEKGYNVMLYVKPDSLSDLNKDDRIAFEGEISRLSAYKGALIDLHSATFRKIETKQ